MHFGARHFLPNHSRLELPVCQTSSSWGTGNFALIVRPLCAKYLYFDCESNAKRDEWAHMSCRFTRGSKVGELSKNLTSANGRGRNIKLSEKALKEAWKDRDVETIPYLASCLRKATASKKAVLTVLPAFACFYLLLQFVVLLTNSFRRELRRRRTWT